MLKIIIEKNALLEILRHYKRKLVVVDVIIIPVNACGKVCDLGINSCCAIVLEQVSNPPLVTQVYECIFVDGQRCIVLAQCVCNTRQNRICAVQVVDEQIVIVCKLFELRGCG